MHALTHACTDLCTPQPPSTALVQILEHARATLDSQPGKSRSFCSCLSCSPKDSVGVPRRALIKVFTIGVARGIAVLFGSQGQLSHVYASASPAQDETHRIICIGREACTCHLENARSTTDNFSNVQITSSCR